MAMMIFDIGDGEMLLAAFVWRRLVPHDDAGKGLGGLNVNR